MEKLQDALGLTFDTVYSQLARFLSSGNLYAIIGVSLKFIRSWNSACHH